MAKESNYKIIFLFVIASFVVPTAFAETIFSDTVYTQNPTEVDDQNLSIDISGDAVVIDYDGLSFFVYGGECQEINFYKACVTDIKQTFSAHVVLTVATGDLNIIKSIKEDKEEFVLGEVFTVKVNVTNTGDSPVTEINLIEDLSDFLIISVTGCQLNGTIVTKNTSLHQNSRFICEYKLRAITPGSFDPKTEISFFNGYENKSKNKEIDIEVVEHKADLENNLEDNYGLGEELEIDFNITSSYPYSITAKLDIVTKGMIVKESTLKTKRNRNMLKWEGQIAADSSFKYTLKVQLINISNSVTTKLTNTYQGGKVENEFIAIIPTESSPPEIKIRTVKDNKIVIRVKNPNSELTFNRLNLQIKSVFNNLSKEEFIEALSEGEQKQIIIEIPIDENVDVYLPVLFSGTFYTSYSEPVTFSTADYINITSGEFIPTQNLTSTAEPENETEETNITATTKSKLKIILTAGAILFVVGLVVVFIFFFISLKTIKNPK